MNKILALVLAIAGLSLSQSVVEAKEVRWKGTVTAVNSNGYKVGRGFTAIDENGQPKMFYIKSLDHLDVGDRVALRYIDAYRFPLNVTTIKFLPPKK
ncbi:MAG: hypothetical protein AAF984_03095 [Verrucomicrobiota bacterium]